MSYVLVISATVDVKYTLNFPLPSSFEPDLVVINTTPFAPLEPYIAVAEASFKISILSMSLGLIPFNPL